MTILITILHVLVCIILILTILLQAGRGQGLSGPTFSSGNVQSLFGTGAADFLTKATSVAAICFLFTCILLGYFETRRSQSLLNFSKQASQIDIDSIKKALEKVKSEEAAKTTGNQAAATAEATAQTAEQTVKTPEAATAPRAVQTAPVEAQTAQAETAAAPS